MCKIALISWPTTNKTPHNLYINLGEIYDKCIKEDIYTLSEFYRDLNYLYPFEYLLKTGKCFNSEDFTYFKHKYSLTLTIKLIGKKPDPTCHKLIFRTPILYDISCMVPLFIPSKYIPINPVLSTNMVSIVLSTIDPISRGKILDNILIYNPKYILLTGEKIGDNYNSTITLMTRYLLKKLFPIKNIVKTTLYKKPHCIIDCLSLLDLLDIDIDTEIRIACSQNDIITVSEFVRISRKLGLINKKISFFCPYY
jgi:hypothetical protein